MEAISSLKKGSGNSKLLLGFLDLPFGLLAALAAELVLLIGQAVLRTAADEDENRVNRLLSHLADLDQEGPRIAIDPFLCQLVANRILHRGLGIHADLEAKNIVDERDAVPLYHDTANGAVNECLLILHDILLLYSKGVIPT